METRSVVRRSPNQLNDDRGIFSTNTQISPPNAPSVNRNVT